MLFSIEEPPPTDHDILKRLQRSLRGKWNPDRECSVHTGSKRCEYVSRRRVIDLLTFSRQIGVYKIHLCGLGLTQVPSEIWEFRHMNELFLERNQLSALPEELGKLRYLSTIHLDNNPLPTPPPEIIQQGVPAILAYLRAFQQPSSSSPYQQPGYPSQLANPNGQPVIQQKPVASYQFAPTVQPNLDEDRLFRVSGPLEIFCCYAREDQGMLAHLKKHLMPLQRQGQIKIWSDTDLDAGMEWERELHRHLESADLILLLISPDFMSSDYCYSTEMKRAIERHDQGHAQVVPILLRSTFWRNAPFAKLQLLPKDAKPVNSWTDMDEAFNDITERIYQLLFKI